MSAHRITSVKHRITLWYALFIALLIALLTTAIFLVQRLSDRDFYDHRLTVALEAASSALSEHGDPDALPEHTDTDVHITVLDDKGNLIRGSRAFRTPPNGDRMRVRVAQAGDLWYLMDAPATLEDGRNVWLRCFISSEVSENLFGSMMIVLAATIPLLIFIAIRGGIALTRRAFRPMDEAIRLAQHIADGEDLKQRLEVDESAGEIAQLARTFNAMLERLERSTEAEKAFISDASHELRTPIGVICAQSEYALSPGRTDEEVRSALRVIYERSTRAGQMVAQLLMLSRMDYDRLPLSFERIDLTGLIESVADEMRPAAEEKGISIVYDAPDGVMCLCDEPMIMSLASNLIRNAVWYGRPGGHTWVTLNEESDEIVFCVRDDGEGMTEDQLEHIYDRFYRADPARTPGAGLGLPLVKGIVRLHGGKIEVRSEVGKGSTFTVRLPRGGQ